MKQFELWLQRERKRNGQLVSLYDMLFAGRSREYLIFRLRWFNLQVFLRFLVHALIFYLMYHHFSAQTLFIIITALAVKLVIANLWWGGLEVLRTQVRHAYRLANHEEVNSRIGYWMIIAVMVAMVNFSLVLWAGYQAWSQSSLPWLIVAIMFFLLSGQILLRCYHSGIYAITRVIRPGLSMIVADLIALTFLALAWPIWSTYSLPLAMLLRGLVSLFLSYHYTTRMYRFYEIKPQLPRRNSFLKQLQLFPFAVFGLGALANACVYMDAFLILGWLALEKWQIAQQHLLIPTSLLIVVLISPLLRAASDWSFLFYFDRKRLDNPELCKFSEQFNRHINRASAIIGLFYWCIAFAVSYVLISKQASYESCILLPFFLMAATITNLQRRAFAEFRYWQVIISGVFMAANMTAAYFLSGDLILRFAWSGVAMLLTYGFLIKPRLATVKPAHSQPPGTHFYHWLQTLHSSLDREVKVHRIYFMRAMLPFQMLAMLHRTGRQLQREQLCILNDRELIFFQSSSSINSGQYMNFMEKSAGLVRRLHSAVFSTEQMQAKPQVVYSNPVFSGLGIAENISDQNFLQWHREKLLYDFLEIFPSACYFTPDYHPGSKARPLDLLAAREINHLIHHYLNAQQSPKDSRIDVSVLYVSGVVEVIFVIPKSRKFIADLRIHSWQERLRSLNVRLALQ